MNQPRLIKLLVLGLPLGLFFLGTASMIWKARHPQSLEKKPLNVLPSKPVSQAALEFSVKRLATELASRPASDPVKMRQTASFIEGMLGMNNMGYEQVTRTKFPSTYGELTNLSVTVKGRRSPEEILLVVAHYDSVENAAGANANGSGVAAGLSLANLLLHTSNPRTVQFHFLANGLGAAPTGADILAQKLHALGSNVKATIVLDQLGKYNPVANSQQPWPNQPAADWPTTGNFLAWISTDQDAALATHCAQQFTSGSALTGVALTTADLASPTAQAFARQGLPTVRATDTGPLRLAARFSETDALGEIDFPTFTEVVRGLGRTLQALAQE